DLLHRCEVLVQHRLTVFDLCRQTARGDRIPSFMFGQRSCRRHDEPAPGGALAQPTIFDGHSSRVAQLPVLALLLTSMARSTSVANASSANQRRRTTWTRTGKSWPKPTSRCSTPTTRT